MTDISTPNEALARLKEGNKRFVTGNLKEKHFREVREKTSTAQHPHSVVLTCIDSRSAAEQFFDVTIGEIFNIRMAGNVVNDDVLGSIEFATEVAGSKLIAVVGHTDCGGVKGAIGNVEMGHLTGLVNQIKPAIEKVPAEIKPKSTENAEFVEAVTRRHIQNVVQSIPARSEVIRSLAEAGKVQLIGGMHHLATGEVTFFE